MASVVLKSMRVDRNEAAPLFVQIEKQIAGLVEERKLRPGDFIPGDLELSAHLGVDRLTVRKGLSRLVRRGLLQRHRGVGTFVSMPESLKTATVGFFYFYESSSLMIRAAEQMKLSGGDDVDLKIIPFRSTFYSDVDISEHVKRMGLQGAVFVPLHGDDCLKSLQRLEAMRFPHVRFGNPLFLGKLKSPVVTGDNRKRMRDALEYLKQRGHRNIGFLSKYTGSVDEQEYLGQLQGVPGFQLRWLETIEFGGTLEQWRKLSGDRIARGYLDEHPELTAIVVEHAPMVVDVLRQARAQGRRVPEDLSILCLGDWGGMEATTPATTAMAISFEELGKVAMELLSDMMETGLPKAERVVRVPFGLIERETVARAFG